MSIAETIRKPFPITPDRPDKEAEAAKLAKLGWSPSSLARRYNWPLEQAQSICNKVAKGQP